MNNVATLSKVPAVTLGFWIIKILATTLGETGGDTVTMTMNWGYLAGTALFLSALAALVLWQILAKKFHPLIYWATITASTTAGTTMADLADRSLGIGYIWFIAAVVKGSCHAAARAAICAATLARTLETLELPANIRTDFCAQACDCCELPVAMPCFERQRLPINYVGSCAWPSAAWAWDNVSSRAGVRS